MVGILDLCFIIINKICPEDDKKIGYRYNMHIQFNYLIHDNINTYS